jgi:hypothetical protein
MSIPFQDFDRYQFDIGSNSHFLYGVMKSIQTRHIVRCLSLIRVLIPIPDGSQMALQIGPFVAAAG